MPRVRCFPDVLGLRRLAGLALVCLICVCPTALWAAEGDEDDAVELPEINVQARRLNESAQDPAAFVEIIEMDQFAGRMISTEEVLRQSAGVSVRRFGGLGSTATVSIRGANANQVVVLVDGVRLNSSAGGSVDLGAIPPDQIQRIEVYRGGDAAFFGEGAIGGVVNIVTRAGAGRPAGNVALTYGSFNTLRSSVYRAGGGGKWRYRASGSYLHSDGDFPYENNRGTTLDDSDDTTSIRVNNQLDSRQIVLGGGLAPRDDVDVAVQNDLYSADAGVPGIVTFPSPHAHRKLLRNLTTASLALTGLPPLSFQTRLTNRYEWTRFRDGVGEQTGVPLVSTRAETEPGVQQRLLWAWGTHQLWTVTGEYRRTSLADADFGNPARDAWAGSLSDQVMLWERRVTLVAALRYDRVGDLGDQWSPKGGLALKPWQFLVLKGNAGRSFRAPNFGELYLDQGLAVGNTALTPERATHYDAGLQLVFLPWVFAEGTYFRSEVTDLIEYLLVNGFRYKPFNIGSARLEGMELSLRARPIAYLSASGSYTLTYAIDTTGQANRDDRQLPGRPRRVGFGRLEGHLGLVQPFVEFNYVGSNFVTQANTKLLPERQVWNAGVIFNVGPGRRLGAEMKNLTDDRAVDVRGFPLPGRAVYLTLEHGF